MPLQTVLLSSLTLAAGAEKRLLPGLDVSEYGRLHFHIASRGRAVAGLHARVLFGTVVGPITLLSDSTVWYEESTSERDFVHTVPLTDGSTGFILSVPVVAPRLYDLILKNTGPKAIEDLYVTLLAK